MERQSTNIDAARRSNTPLSASHECSSHLHEGRAHKRSNIDISKIYQAIAADGHLLGICPEFASIRPQFDIHTFQELPSTNTHLWQLLNQGASAGTVVIARQQSAGKGQRQRQWISEPGGLYLSLALEPDWPATHSPLLTCISAWGIATAFRNLGIPIDVKWPNDLYYRGQKLGGILTETKLAHLPSANLPSPTAAEHAASVAYIKQAVIGVGINWHNRPPHSGINLAEVIEVEKSSKTDKNKINCLEGLVALVLRGILQGYFFQQRSGNQDFMKAYQKLLTQVGHTVSLDTNGLLSLATPTQSGYTTSPESAGLDEPHLAEPSAQQWANRSGEVIGVSEEGYLKVALQAPEHPPGHHTSDSATNILLLKPSEIHIS